MDAQTFLDNFGTIARAPGGIDQLRQLVLNLAVRGALIDQDLGEEPVENALCSLWETKSEFLKAKVQGRTKIPRVVDDSERTSEVPNGWSWARIDDTGQYVNGLAFKAADWQNSGIPIIRIQNLSDPSKEFNYTHGNHPADQMVVTGDLLVSWSATLDVFVWDRGDGAVNQHIFKVIPEERVVAKSFLFYLLKHTIQVLAASDALHGLAMKHINRGPFVSHPVLIPPLAEQHRIVAKVDELMALCDQLETQQQTRTQTTTKLRASALNALTTAETADDLQTAWQRIHTNWETLVSGSQSVANLREAIFSLAIRGRLTEQDSAEGTAAELLAEVQAVRRTKGLKNFPVEGQEEGEFRLPQSWDWAEFGVITEKRLGKMLDKAKNSGTPRQYLRNVNVRWFAFNLDDLAFMRIEDHELDEFRLQIGDLLICEGGEPGRAAVCDGSVEGLIFQKALHRARPLAGIDSNYLALTLRDGAASARLSRYFTGATIKHLTGKSLALFPVPLPPMAEQRRIVSKVDELMDLCDQLEAHLVERDRVGEALAASVVDAFAA